MKKNRMKMKSEREKKLDELIKKSKKKWKELDSILLKIQLNVLSKPKKYKP